MTPKRATATMLWLALCAVVVLVIVGLAASPASSAQAAAFDAGLAADGSSSSPAISADGRYVAFVSSANNLSDQDQDRFTNVFVRDLVANTTTLVSRQSTSLGGRGANGSSSAPSVSADGRYVLFLSRASNLTAPGARHSAQRDVFFRDLLSGTTELLSAPVRTARGWGVPGQPRLSADGRTVAFALRSPSRSDRVAVRRGGTTRLFVAPPLCVGNCPSSARGPRPWAMLDELALSADGQHVAYTGFAPSLLARDLRTQRVERFNETPPVIITPTRPTPATAALALPEEHSPLSLSGNGRLLVFSTSVGGSVLDITTRKSHPVACDTPVISTDGHVIACIGKDKTVGNQDDPESVPRGIVTRSLTTGRVTCALCALDPYTSQFDLPDQLSISGDGHRIAFRAKRPDLSPIDNDLYTNVYVHDTSTGQTTLVSRQTGPGA